MIGIDSFLQKHTKVGVDSNIIIAVVENSKEYGQEAIRAIRGIEKNNNEVWLCTMSITELLIKPISLRLFNVVESYKGLLFYGLFNFAPIRERTSLTAAELGAKYNLKVVDSIIITSLLENGVTGFITADKDFKLIEEIDTLILS